MEPGAPPLDPLSITRVKVIRDQAYGSNGDRAERCDVYLPRTDAPPEGRPAVLVVHGGGWVSGDKSIVSRYAVTLAQQGMVAIAINYHFAPQYKYHSAIDFPVQQAPASFNLDQIKAKIEEMRQRAKAHGIRN